MSIKPEPPEIEDVARWIYGLFFYRYHATESMVERLALDIMGALDELDQLDDFYEYLDRVGVEKAALALIHDVSWTIEVHLEEKEISIYI